MHIIKQLRMHHVQLKALLSRPARRFSRELSTRAILAEGSSDSGQDSEIEDGGTSWVKNESRAAGQYPFVQKVFDRLDRKENKKLLLQFMDQENCYRDINSA